MACRVWCELSAQCISQVHRLARRWLPESACTLRTVGVSCPRRATHRDLVKVAPPQVEVLDISLLESGVRVSALRTHTRAVGVWPLWAAASTAVNPPHTHGHQRWSHWLSCAVYSVRRTRSPTQLLSRCSRSSAAGCASQPRRPSRVQSTGCQHGSHQHHGIGLLQYQRLAELHHG